MNNNKIFLSTFMLVFFAELGDKTQIASFSLAARYSQLAPVIIGASAAFICSSLLAVYLGHKISTIVPQKRIKLVCGILFILTGIYMLIRNLLKILLNHPVATPSCLTTVILRFLLTKDPSFLTCCHFNSTLEVEVQLFFLEYQVVTE